MKVGRVLLFATAVVICASLVLLVLEVSKDTSVDVPESDLDRARQRYARGQATHTPRPRAEPARANPRPRPAKPRSDEPAEPDDADDADDTDDTDEPRRPRARPIIRTPESDAPEDKSFARQVGDVRQAYDRFDFPGAMEQARELLREQPDHVYLNRVMVSAACGLGEEAVAREYFAKLEPRARAGLAVRCKRYEVILEE